MCRLSEMSRVNTIKPALIIQVGVKINSKVASAFWKLINILPMNVIEKRSNKLYCLWKEYFLVKLLLFVVFKILWKIVCQPFHSQDLSGKSPYCLTCNSCDVSSENMVLDQPIISLIDIFLYSHHLSAWYCINIIRRNSVLVIHMLFIFPIPLSTRKSSL